MVRGMHSHAPRGNAYSAKPGYVLAVFQRTEYLGDDGLLEVYVKW